MPLIVESHDSLRFADAEPTEQALEAALALISAELDPSSTTSSHPSLPPQYTPKFSPFIEAELSRLTAEAPRTGGIDLSRYEPIDAPPRTSPTTDEDYPEILEQWRKALRQSYANSEYLSGRLANLGLLERFGKNAWLIGNSQLEDILKGIETELAETKRQVEETEQARRAAQEGVRGEMETLERSWKQGVERMIATEVAAEGLRRQILDRKRQEAAQGTE